MATRTQEALRRAKVGRMVGRAIDDFIEAKQAENLTPKTLAWYRWLREKFAASLTDQHLTALTLANARAFIAQLQARDTRYEHHPIPPSKEGGLSDCTISAYARTLKVFSTWLDEEGFPKRISSPASNVPRRRSRSLKCYRMEK